MNILLTFLGLFIGGASGSVGGALIGACAGAAFASTIQLRKRILEQGRELVSLAKEVRSLKGQLAHQPVDSGNDSYPEPVAGQQEPNLAQQEGTTPASTARSTREFAHAVFRDESPTNKPAAPDEGDLDPWPELGAPTVKARSSAPRAMSALDRAGSRAAEAIREFFTGGNTVVRVGLLVLMVGVVLLLKYAADQHMFPIEARMGSAALLGFGLVAFGFRQREARPGFSTTLQGGGVAILYLVVFFSMRVYGLLPIPLGFGLLAAIALFSGTLAVLQDSLALIVIGIVGGFLAPILASTGDGSHVALFSYYLLLNLLIVGVAWFKSWRPLNLLGFGFTFGVGTIWGVLKYTPEHFASTEPFLVAFFLMYVSIVVLFAWRRPAQLKGWVDGSLTFGTPLAFLGLQYELVKDMPFGMAYSAAGIAVVYAVAASALFRRAPQAMRNLVEAFLALAIGFGTLAIPYGFSNHSLTGATWAVEGLGLYWLGIRQSRWLSRAAGLVLQLLAGIALCVSLIMQDNLPPSLPVLNAPYFASFLLAFSGMGVACLFARKEGKLASADKLANLLIPWAMLWWYLGNVRELMEHVEVNYRSASLLALVAGTSLLLEVLGKRLNWLAGRLPALLSGPAMLLVLLTAYRFDFRGLNDSNDLARATRGLEPFLRLNPLEFGGWIAWPLCLCSSFFVLFRMSRDQKSIPLPFHAGTLWTLALFSALTSAHMVRNFEELGYAWPAAALGCGVLVVLGLAGKLRDKIVDEDLRLFYQRVASGGLALAVAVWMVRTSLLSSGHAAPLPYLPLINPIDVSCGLAFLGILFWSRSLGLRLGQYLTILLFLWFNGVLARTVHQYTEADYTRQSLWSSVPMQVSVSVSWALIGLATIGWATRAKLRPIWFGGGGLLAVVVAKLFFVDLKHLSSVAKIGTFLVVGLLLLVVGYFSPVPPAEVKPKSDPELDVDPS